MADAHVHTGPALADRPSDRGIPCLALVRETVLRNMGSTWSSRYVEVQAAALRLSFDYGGTRIAMNDPCERILAPGCSPLVRDRRAELEARRFLERFGVVDLDCTDECVRTVEASADYVIDLDGGADALVRFELEIVPRLREAGWRVETDPHYPCKVVRDACWYADFAAGDDDGDWFELRLGVEVDGRHVDLLPVLLDVLETAPRNLSTVVGAGRRFMAVPLGEDCYLPIPADRVLALLTVVRELYELEGDTPGGALRVPATIPGLLDDVRAAVGSPSANPQLDRSPRPVLRSPGELPPAEPPARFAARLRPYQCQGLAWLQSLADHRMGGVLADDMGLGKTIQAIAHICAQAERGRLGRPALVVAPTSLVANWRRELHRFASHLRVLVMHGPDRHRRHASMADADVVVTTYPLLLRDSDRYAKQAFSLQILDEAQTVKNARSQAHQVCRRIEAGQRICLTGTPIENNLEELRALFDLIVPGLLGDAGAFRFLYRDPIEKLGDEERLASLRKRVAPFVLRRTKEQVLTELPPKTEVVRTIDLGSDQRELYESIRIAAHASVRTVIRNKGIAASSIDILGALMKLRQVCCDPRLVAVDAARELTSSAKLEVLLEMLDELLGQGRRILVFSQFTSMLAIVGQALTEKNIRHLALTGATKSRQQVVDRFERRLCDVFLISLKAGGTGLNLTSADTVIHYEPWWNPAAQRQATDRAYRIGQSRPVLVYDLIVAGSVEERMLRLQRKKQRLADGILAEAEGTAVLTESDVEDLFAPLSD